MVLRLLKTCQAKIRATFCGNALNNLTNIIIVRPPLYTANLFSLTLKQVLIF